MQENGRTVGIRKMIRGMRVSDLNPRLDDWILVGSEGEEGEGDKGGSDGSGAGESQAGNQSGGEGSQGGSGEGGEGGSGDGSGDGSGEGDGEGGEGNQDTFDRSYVEKLRKESADYRTRAKAAEEELEEKRKAEMSELEQAQVERDKEKQRGDTLESELDNIRLQMAVSNAAAAANFHDPQDALSLIDKETISKNDEGEYNRQSVEAAVKRLADSKPHLIKGKNAGAGSGDGGARGQGGGNMTEQEKQQALEKEYQERGGVPVPKL